MSAVFQCPVRCSLVGNMTTNAKCAQVIFELQMITTFTGNIRAYILTQPSKNWVQWKHTLARDDLNLYLFPMQMKITKALTLTAIKSK